MKEVIQLVVFRLEAQRYALPLGVVERITRAVEVTPLPEAPDVVLGVIDVGGTVLPVLNIRRRFGLPEREIGLSDQFIISRTTERRVVLVVDDVQGVVERRSEELIGNDEI